jgi:hypothetical protein
MLNMDPRYVRDEHERRMASLRRRPRLPRRHPARRPLRRWVGRQMIRFGRRLVLDPSLRPARPPRRS